MNKQNLLRVERSSFLTPTKIKIKQPTLFKKMSKKASISLKSNAITKLKNAPKDIRNNLKKLNFSLLNIKIIFKAPLNIDQTMAEQKKEIKTELVKHRNCRRLDNLL